MVISTTHSTSTVVHIHYTKQEMFSKGQWLLEPIAAIVHDCSHMYEILVKHSILSSLKLLSGVVTVGQ